MTRWVISVISKRGTDVGFTPNSDRNCDLASGRYVPLATKVHCSRSAAIRFLVSSCEQRLGDSQAQCFGGFEADARLEFGRL